MSIHLGHDVTWADSLLLLNKEARVRSHVSPRKSRCRQCGNRQEFLRIHQFFFVIIIPAYPPSSTVYCYRNKRIGNLGALDVRVFSLFAFLVLNCYRCQVLMYTRVSAVHTQDWMLTSPVINRFFFGFKPCRSRRIFQGEEILSIPSFGGEVKPSVPCRRFTACKRFLNATWKSGISGKIHRPFLAHIVPPLPTRISGEMTSG